MPEKRLALNQVPLQAGGGGGGSFSLVTKEVVSSTTPLSPVPVGVPTPVPGTLLAFTLNLDQEVMLVATGTYRTTGAGDTSVEVGFKIDGADTFLSAVGVQTSGRNDLTFTIHKAVPLTAGPHTVEVIAKELIAANGIIENTATRPTILTAFYVDPIGAVATLTKQEAIAQGGGSFATNSLAYVPVPATKVTINLNVQQTVFLLATCTKDTTGFHLEDIGIRVTSPGPSVTDFAGTTTFIPVMFSMELPMVAQKALLLGPGTHEAEIILRTRGAASAKIRTDSDAPAILTALYSSTEEIPKLTSTPPEVVNAGDTPQVGILGEAARADHEHGVATATPVDTGKTNAEGVGTDLARADHVHRTLIEVQDGGAVVASRPTINLIGATSVVDNGGSDRVDITVTPANRILTVKFHAQGKVVVATKIDGTWVAGRAMTLTRVTLHRETAGSGGSTIADVNINGVTVFTSQANRPTVTQASGNDQIDAHTDMEVTAIAQNDKVTVDVDQAEAGNPEDVTVTLEFEVA